MRSFVVALCFGAVAAHFAAPDPEKFKPLITACESMDLLANCSSVFHGVCKTGHDGLRWCNTCGEHEHGHHSFWHDMHKMKKMIGFHDDDKHHGSWKKVGDCDANKEDGDACKVESAGQCIPAGKCPMFHGEMICRPNDSHPPKFVTEPCKGKEEGDGCKQMLVSGTCMKPKYLGDMYCKVEWPSREQVTDVFKTVTSFAMDQYEESQHKSESSESQKPMTVIV